MSYTFSTFLTSNLHLNAEDVQVIIEKCPTKKVKKGEFLLQEGQYCTQTFFVEKGLFKQYSIDMKGKEHILYFAPESWFLTDRASLFFNQPSIYFIEALEDAQVRVLDEDFVCTLSETIKGFAAFNTQLLHSHIYHLQRRITQLQSSSAEERYLEFIQLYPDISLRVPQALIAAFLGITPESLSRVRKELSQRPH